MDQSTYESRILNLIEMRTKQRKKKKKRSPVLSLDPSSCVWTGLVLFLTVLVLTLEGLQRVKEDSDVDKVVYRNVRR